MRQKLKPNSHSAFPFPVVGKRMSTIKQCPNVPAWSCFFAGFLFGFLLDLCVCVCVCFGGECKYITIFKYLKI